MAVSRRYTSQLIVLEEPQFAGEIHAWSERSKRPLSDLLRDALRRGWHKVRRDLMDEHGSLTTAEKHRGVYRALPPADRADYAIKHGLGDLVSVAAE